MAQKLLTLDEAAARLGISSDELVKLIDQRKIFAIKDGGSWKFKAEEVERYKADRAGSGAGSAEKAYYLPEGDESQDDGGLVTDALVGGAPGSSTIIGPSGGDVLGHDSDLTLGSGSGSGTGSDSDVKLVPDADLEAGSGSGIKLVPNVGSGSGSDLQMLDLNSGSGTFKLQDEDATIEAKPGSGIKLGGSSGKLAGGSGVGKSGSGVGKSGSSGKLGAGSDLTISESGLSLGEDDDVQIGGPSSAKAMNSSKLKLADDQQFEDDDIVLGGSSGGASSGLGSGIGDSGINLAAAADSGLSLEEPLELSGEDGVSDDSGETEMSSDDDFLLTPMLELDDQDSSDSSGSQVIALDSDAVVDDQAATLLGSDPGVAAAMAGPASQAMGPGPMMMVPATPQAQHSGFTVSFLVLSFLVMSLIGMMMFEMVRHIWSWDSPHPAPATIMNALVNLLG
jgi:excisionase family DNA binding protein